MALAGAIVVSPHFKPGEHDLTPFRETIDSLRNVSQETIVSPGLPPADFIHLLQATRALEGDQLWGQNLELLDAGEFEGTCPACNGYLLIVIGEHGFFVTKDEWVNHPHTRRIELHPAESSELAGIAATLLQAATAGAQPEVALWIRYTFGHGTCPTCDSRFEVAQAIALMATR